MSATSKATRRYFRRGAEERSKANQRNTERTRKTLVTMRLPASLTAQVQELTLKGLATGNYPWRTYTDCYQAMILRGLRQFRDEQNDPYVDEVVEKLEASIQMDVIESNRVNAETALRRTCNEISELLNINREIEAVQLYHAAKLSTEQMPPTVWRRWLLEELQKAFPGLDKQKPRGVCLLPETRHGTRH